MEDKYSLDRSSPGPSESFRRALGSGRRQTEPRVCPEWGPGRFLGYDQEQSRAESETMSLVLAGSTDRLHVQPIQRFPIKIVFIVFTRNKDLRINKYLTLSAGTSVPLRRARRPPQSTSPSSWGGPDSRRLRVLRTWNCPCVTMVWPGVTDPNPGACYFHFWFSALTPQKPDELITSPGNAIECLYPQAGTSTVADQQRPTWPESSRTSPGPGGPGSAPSPRS